MQEAPPSRSLPKNSFFMREKLGDFDGMGELLRDVQRPSAEGALGRICILGNCFALTPSVACGRQLPNAGERR